MAKYEGTKLANFQPIEKVGTLEVLDIEIGAGREVEPGGDYYSTLHRCSV